MRGLESEPRAVGINRGSPPRASSLPPCSICTGMPTCRNSASALRQFSQAARMSPRISFNVPRLQVAIAMLAGSADALPSTRSYDPIAGAKSPAPRCKWPSWVQPVAFSGSNSQASAYGAWPHAYRSKALWRQARAKARPLPAPCSFPRACRSAPSWLPARRRLPAI
jgi:hypothetical protein